MLHRWICETHERELLGEIGALAKVAMQDYFGIGLGLREEGFKVMGGRREFDYKNSTISISNCNCPRVGPLF